MWWHPVTWTVIGAVLGGLAGWGACFWGHQTASIIAGAVVGGVAGFGAWFWKVIRTIGAG